MSKYQNHYRREKLKKRVFAGKPDCYLCGEPIDYSLPAGLPGSPEMDDLIPVSKGGDPLDVNNLKATHKACNISRGNMPVDIILRKNRENTKNSRNW